MANFLATKHGRRFASVVAVTALPTAMITAFVIASLGPGPHVETAGAAQTTIAPPTTVSAEDLATVETVDTTTTILPPLDISEPIAVEAESKVEAQWARTQVGECACSVAFPWAVTTSPSSLPDGREAKLYLSQNDASPISAALWTTASSGASSGDELLATLDAVAGESQKSDVSSTNDRATATLKQGKSVSKVDVHLLGDKVVVLFIGSSTGEGIDAAAKHYFTSFNA